MNPLTNTYGLLYFEEARCLRIDSDTSMKARADRKRERLGLLSTKLSCAVAAVVALATITRQERHERGETIDAELPRTNRPGRVIRRECLMVTAYAAMTPKTNSDMTKFASDCKTFYSAASAICVGARVSSRDLRSML